MSNTTINPPLPRGYSSVQGGSVTNTGQTVNGLERNLLPYAHTERALKKIGPEGTREEFNEVIGRAVSVDTTLRTSKEE